MPRIDSLPGIKIIRGFRGVLDFYMQRGRAYVRSWPVTPRRNLTPATLAAAAIFGAVLKSYRLLAETVLVAFQADAADHERTARDIYVAAVHGHLHEAAMSDFLTALQACRDSLAALEALLGALHSAATDDFDVHVHESVLPAGAATAAHQITQTTALEKIDELPKALESVATDRLIVKGEDQLFSYKAQYAEVESSVTGAAGTRDLSFSQVPANEVWFVHTVVANNKDTVNTRTQIALFKAANAYELHTEVPLAAEQRIHFSGLTTLVYQDRIRVRFFGCLLNDDIYAQAIGIKMTLET